MNLRKNLPLLALVTVVAQAKPNLVFMLSDDLAQGDVGAYGQRLIRTPNLDRIASEGAIFTRSYCCNSICGPSRAAILTGKHSAINGFLDNNNSTFDGSQTTFPKLLQQVGYQTAIVGKWHLVSQPRGFDYWEILPGQGSYYNPDFITASGRKKYTGYCTDIVTDRAIEWLEKGRDRDKPFVLMCQHKAPHRNWSPALRHADLFDEVTIPAENLIGEEGKGFRYILSGMNAERILIGAECIGDAKWFIDKATRYAGERVVFGRPIGRNQGVQFPIARAFADIKAGRAAAPKIILTP